MISVRCSIGVCCCVAAARVATWKVDLLRVAVWFWKHTSRGLAVHGGVCAALVLPREITQRAAAAVAWVVLCLGFPVVAVLQGLCYEGQLRQSSGLCCGLGVVLVS